MKTIKIVGAYNWATETNKGKEKNFIYQQKFLNSPFLKKKFIFIFINWVIE